MIIHYKNNISGSLIPWQFWMDILIPYFRMNSCYKVIAHFYRQINIHVQELQLLTHRQMNMLKFRYRMRYHGLNKTVWMETNQCICRNSLTLITTLHHLRLTIPTAMKAMRLLLTVHLLILRLETFKKHLKTYLRIKQSYGSGVARKFGARDKLV